MKLYYICECCQCVFNTSEVEGPEGAIELKGICDECALEMGMAEQHSSVNSQHFYS